MEFSQYLIMVVHAGQVSPTFVTSDFNEALKTSRKHTFTRHYINECCRCKKARQTSIPSELENQVMDQILCLEAEQKQCKWDKYS